jgi:deoxyribodipyrimidine photolyase-related protein
MSSIVLIFPHQLFQAHPALSPQSKVYLIEYGLHFTQYIFHKQKLMLHRSTMKYYEQHLLALGHEVHYIAHHQPEAQLDVLFTSIHQSGVTHIRYADPVDYLLERRMARSASRHGLTLAMTDTPAFICSSKDNREYFDAHKYFLKDYYVSLRKKYNILLTDGQPTGGKWSYDTENRSKMPKGAIVPRLPVVPASTYTDEARKYVTTHFGSNYGSLALDIYPSTHQQASDWLDRFLSERFTHYGVYQDAIVEGQNWLFHAILTPMLNVGLLQPDQIIDRAIAYADLHHIPINSLEGFVRQILGWREYIRAVYVDRGVYERTHNYWGHSRKIPQSFWTGSTGIQPVDDAIHRLLDTGYNHHIERLMVLGNFMLLCEFDPDEVYRWFMEMYIDSYDWVMVPNVYGMSQYADGGLMSTKPYISGSNYISKMSNYPKGEWSKVWDGLFWRFIYKHHAQFIKNPRMSMMAVQVTKMNPETLQNHLAAAEQFLHNL